MSDLPIKFAAGQCRMHSCGYTGSHPGVHAFLDSVRHAEAALFSALPVAVAGLVGDLAKAAVGAPSETSGRHQGR